MEANVVEIARMREAASDAEIVTLISQGDPLAEQALVLRFSRGVMVLLVAQTRDRELAQDLHQETFKSVLRRARAGEIHKPKSLKSFVYQTAINTLVGHRRKEIRSPLEHDDGHLMRVADASAGPLGRLESEQTIALLRRAVEELVMPRDRILLKRYYLDQVSKQRICKELELSSEHFDRVLFRARNRLKSVLEMEISGTRHGSAIR